jgi:hypothetical protein
MKLIFCAALLVGCAQGSEAQVRDMKLPDGTEIKHLEVKETEDGGRKTLNVDYRTSISVKGTCQIQAEVRKLFKAHLEIEAERVGAKEVDIWPKDPSGVAHNFLWVRLEGSSWKEEFGFKKCR